MGLTLPYMRPTKAVKLRNNGGPYKCFLRRRRDLHIEAAPRAGQDARDWYQDQDQHVLDRKVTDAKR
jgi:hypothetical protein